MQFIKSLFGKKSPPVNAQLAGPALTPQAWLLELFKHHGLASTLHHDWVLPNAELPSIRATWHPGETHGRLDVQVLVRDGVLIDERFAGIGAGDVGLADGLRNFTINSFHPLLSALWHHHDRDQVETAAWAIDGRHFDAFIGNLGTRSSTGSTPTIPTDTMQRLEAAIKREALEHDLHWFRFYVGHVKGEFTFEALKDNAPWPAGVRALDSCGWAAGDAFYSARLFMVLRPRADAAQPVD